MSNDRSIYSEVSASRSILVNWGQVICPLNRDCPHFKESIIRGFNVCLMSAIEGLLCYVCMKGVCLVISPHNASGSREKKKNGVGMALDVATLPLILYRRPGIYNH